MQVDAGMENLESLLMTGQFCAAADASAAVLHSAAEQGIQPLTQQRLMYVLLQSHFYANR